MDDSIDTLRSRACLALDFLNNHPALHASGSDFMGECSFWMSRMCKRGLHESQPIIVEASNPRINEFRDKIDPGDDYACVSYEEYHGEPWKFHNVEYGIATSFRVYDRFDLGGKVSLDDWSRYEGFHIFGTSFEGVVIATAAEAARIFGPFNDESFLTEEEKDNHKNNDAFVHSSIPDNNEDEEIKSNPLYIWIRSEEINRRWLKWFVNTEWCKKNWENTFCSLAQQGTKYVEPVAVKLLFEEGMS